MYIYFSIIKEKLNFLLSNMYLKKEKKTRFELKIFKEVHWCRVIQWFLSIVQATNISPRSFPLSKTWYIFVRDTYTYWKALWAGILYKISHENKPEQSKPFSVLASLLALSSVVSFSLLISFMISALHPQTRYATYNQETSVFERD